MLWYVSGPLEVRRITCGVSQGAVKLLTEFWEATEMAARSRSEVYRAILFERGLLSMGMEGLFKDGISQ